MWRTEKVRGIMKEIFKVDISTFNENQIWEHYDKVLNSHDWMYEHSDDFSVWARGKSERAYIEALRLELYDYGNKSSADHKFYAYSPDHNIDGTLKDM